MDWSSGVPFAVDASGAIRDVDTVENGLNCGCFCAACRGQVVARQGEVRVHHFAHHDRKECRHALEASLYLMLIALLKEPGCVLGLPPWGRREELVPIPRAIFTRAQEEEFFRAEWILDEREMKLDAPVVLSSSIEASTLTQADVSLENGKLLVHVISHRKTMEQAALLPRNPGQSVLAINLRSYLERWWSTCDPTITETVKEAATATNAMRRWLRDPQAGKSWIANPEFEKKRAELLAWIRVCKQEQQAQARLQQPPPDFKGGASSWRRINTPDTPDQILDPHQVHACAAERNCD